MQCVILLVTLLSNVIAVIATSKKSIVIPLQRHRRLNNSYALSNHFHYDENNTYKNASFEKRKRDKVVSTFSLGHITDFYYGSFEIGTHTHMSSQKEFRLIVDTSANQLWVIGVESNQVNCGEDYECYDPKMSETSVPYAFDVDQEDPCLGKDYFDVVTYEQDLRVSTPIFVCDTFLYDGPIMDGEIGFSYNMRKNSHLNWEQMGIWPTFFQILCEEKRIEKPIFGLYIARNPEGSSLILGDYDRKKLGRNPCFAEIQSEKHWIIRFNSITVKGIKLRNSGRLAFIHTTLNSIRVPPEDVYEIYEKIPNAVPIPNTIFRQAPCDTIPEVGIVIDDFEFKIHGPDLITKKEGNTCVLAIVGDSDPGIWQLGIPFLKNVYTVFDWGNAAIWLNPLPFRPEPYIDDDNVNDEDYDVIFSMEC